MKDKIRPYVTGVFEEVQSNKNNPQTSTLLMEMKEELISNLEARYDEECRAGVPKAQAYADTIEYMGDIRELFTLTDEDLPQLYVNPDYAGYQMPEEDMRNLQKEEKFHEIEKSNKRLSKLVTTTSNLVVASVYFYMSIRGFWPWSTSWIIMFVLGITEGIFCKSLGALRLLPYASFSEEELKKQKKRLKGGIADAYWCIVLMAYFLFSFNFASWGYSWIIFIVAALFALVAGNIFGFVDEVDNDNDNDDDNKKMQPLLTFLDNPKSVQSIEISSAAGSIEIRESTDGQFHIENCNARYTNGKVVFKTSGRGVVSIPQEYTGPIYAKSTSGNIMYNPGVALMASSVSLKGVSGSIQATNVSGPFFAKTVSGKLDVSYLTVLGSSKLETVSGNICVKTPQFDHYLVNTNTVSGHINSFGQGYFETPNGNASGTVSVSSVSGNISVLLKD